MGPVSWDHPDGVGPGRFVWNQVEWEMLDYGDALPLDPQLNELLQGLAEGADDASLERRQCLLLHVAAGALLARSGQVPDISPVWDFAARFRRSMYDQARDAELALGDTPAFVTQAEADLRMLAHDLS